MAHEHGMAASATKQYYTCGMHPWVILPEPGNCPICHMALVPLDPAKFSSEISIDPVITQNIGVRVVPVTLGPVRQIIRTVGDVDYNETAFRDLNLRVGGWVVKLYVDSVGQTVEKHQPLLDINSPDLYTAQEEFLQALKSRSKPAQDGGWQGDLVSSSRKRLLFLGMTDEEIDALAASGKPNGVVTLRSPFAGTVVDKNVLAGGKVEPGVQLYRIADLSSVWVQATLYEFQLPYVQLGQKAVMSLTYIPGQTFEGRVAYIYPFLNQELRQAKVRLEFVNPQNLLKPGMYANVEIQSTLANDRVLVPREAVMDTGQRQVAFVSLGEGRFEPRVVRMGAEAEGGMVEILDGLKSGELVVVSGEFLLDSESRLRESLAKMIRGQSAAGPVSAAATTSPASMPALPETVQKSLVSVIEGYFVIGDKLADDTIEGVSAPAKQVADAVSEMLTQTIPSQEHFFHQHTELADLRDKALKLSEEKDLAAAREACATSGTSTGPSTTAQ
jgi:multidrug efflux pump subunit AcrA (membrane-fusion protein)